MPGAPRACADFCDPTAASRFNDGPKIGCESDQVIFSQVLRACAAFCDPTAVSRLKLDEIVVAIVGLLNPPVSPFF